MSSAKSKTSGGKGETSQEPATRWFKKLSIGTKSGPKPVKLHADPTTNQPGAVCSKGHLLLLRRAFPGYVDHEDKLMCDICMTRIVFDQPNSACISCRACRVHVCSNCANKQLGVTEKGQVHCAIVSENDIDSEELVHVKRVKWNPTYFRGYCNPSLCKTSTTQHTTWAGRLASAKHTLYPLYCPSGWFRLSVNVDSSHLPDWGSNWQTLYHGIHPQVAHKVYESGFLARECQHDCTAVYLSPSIKYCAHPRYARVIRHKGWFYQFIIEARVDVRKIKAIKKRETLSVGKEGNIDPHFPDNENLEHLIVAEHPADDGHTFVAPSDGLVMSGVMIRRLPHDPALLPESWWWDKWKSLPYLRQRYYCPNLLPEGDIQEVSGDEDFT